MKRKSVVVNMLWRLGERVGAQGVSFVVSIILARLLLPEDYGVVSIITVFTEILTLFIDSGFKNALIQKKNADQLDFSTVFFFNIFMGVVLYTAMFFAAPWISDFYSKPYMTPYIRVMSLTLILGGINGVQQAVVSIRMQFKRFFYATLIGTVFSAFLGIWMAYRGYGVWALVAQKLSNQAIDTIILWITVKWRPTMQFSLKRLKPMFNYGSKILLSSLLNKFTQKLSSLLIGKFYSTADLAYYERSEHFPGLVSNTLQTAVQSVLMPVMSQEQDRKNELKKILRRSVTMSSYLIFPCLIGLAACSGSLVRAIYTEKWSAMIPYMRFCCIGFVPFMLHTANLQLIQATGHSEIFLRLEVIKQTVSLLILVCAIRYGVMALIVSNTVFSLLSFAINAYPNKQLADYGWFDQLRDILPILAVSLCMGAAVFLMDSIPINSVLLLLMQILAGSVIYIVGSLALRIDAFYYILDTIKGFIKK